MKKVIKLIFAFSMLMLLVSCAEDKPPVQDGDDMVYNDVDYRTEYANALDFDSVDGNPYWAVAYLGYGDVGRDMREIYVLNAFDTLPEESINKVQHFDYQGDEWYLIIPRYKGDNVILNLETNEQVIVHDGAAFSIKCNLSDLHPNVEISIDTHGGHKFSPQIDGTGILVVNENIWDITEDVLPKFE